MSTIEPDSSSSPNGQAHARFVCCFGQRRRSSWWDRVRSTSWSGNRWWTRGLTALKKLRHWSEILAGPRWKTFIRRFNRNRSPKRTQNYNYDPLSYALNFDQGHNGDFNDDAFRNFSTRYAAVNGKSVSNDTVSDDAVLV